MRLFRPTEDKLSSLRAPSTVCYSLVWMACASSWIPGDTRLKGSSSSESAQRLRGLSANTGQPEWREAFRGEWLRQRHVDS